MTRAGRLAAVLVWLAAGAARAGDGVVEIGQACAAGAGCFPGDGPGFPVQITSPGSYRLVSDLFVSDAAAKTSGIVISASWATLDLGGHEIRGAATCAGTPPVCAPATASGAGVLVASGAEGAEIRNGGVSGFGRGVAVAARNAAVVALRASGNVLDGIDALGAVGCRLVRCSATGNGGSGVYFDGSSRGGFVSECSADGNAGAGISVGTGSLLASTPARGNATNGIVARGLAVGGTASGNAIDGYSVPGAGLLVDVGAYGNGRTGITSLLGAPLAVNRSVVRGNGALGIVFAGVGAYRDDVITGNATAPLSAGSDRAGNHCAGAGTLSATCP